MCGSLVSSIPRDSRSSWPELLARLLLPLLLTPLSFKSDHLPQGHATPSEEKMVAKCLKPMISARPRSIIATLSTVRQPRRDRSESHVGRSEERRVGKECRWRRGGGE